MQTYYQCYWNKTSEENIRILRMFGESEEAVVPEMIAGRAVVEITALRCPNICRQSMGARSASMTQRKKHGRRYRQMGRTGTHALWNLVVPG